MRSVSLALAALLATSLLPAQAPADAALTRAVRAWTKVKTLRATVEQTMTNPLTGRTVTSRGTVQQRRPGRFAVRFTDPAGDVIVSDGKMLWLYLPSTTPGQVIRSPIEQGKAGSIDLTEQFLAQPRSKYDVVDGGTESVDGRSTRVLRLTPKAGQQLGFVRAKVWIDDKDGMIRQFESTDASGLARKVRLSNLRINAPVDASAFRFVPPDGARVIER